MTDAAQPPGSGLMSAAWSVPLILVVDTCLVVRAPSVPVTAAMDEVAHALTAYLLAVAWRLPTDRLALLSVLAGAVLIDADHVPMHIFGYDVLTRGTGRPYGHSLATVLALLAVSRAVSGRRRRALGALGVGVALHLLRDMATGGVPLVWPASTATVGIPYALYLALLLVAGRRVLRRAAPGVDAPRIAAPL